MLPPTILIFLDSIGHLDLENLGIDIWVLFRHSFPRYHLCSLYFFPVSSLDTVK
jgi:hypothetical protein